MGCSSSSGASNPKGKGNAAKNIKFKDAGVHSVDTFTNKVRQVVKEFTELLEPLEKAEHKFADNTGFWRERHASKLTLV